MNEYDYKAFEILFVDDLMSNVERAQSAGWQAVHYVDRSSFDKVIGRLLTNGV